MPMKKESLDWPFFIPNPAKSPPDLQFLTLEKSVPDWTGTMFRKQKDTRLLSDNPDHPGIIIPLKTVIMMFQDWNAEVIMNIMYGLIVEIIITANFQMSAILLPVNAPVTCPEDLLLQILVKMEPAWIGQKFPVH
jgi:hypothetical protein